MIKMIELLDLGDKRNAPAKKLSGGQKRKLSVGIALIAGSKVNYYYKPQNIQIILF